MRRLLKLGVVTATLLLTSAMPAFAQIEGAVDLEALNVFAMTLYLTFATGLVFLMHAGFSMLEAGMTRQKNAANIIGKNLLTITLGTLTYYVVGWAFMYGDSIGGLIGGSGFLLSNASGGAGELITTEIDFAFQAMFAATAATIVSGAVAERIKFGAYLVVVMVLTGLIYPVVGAWTWGGGWLAGLGFTDFAGSTIVHLTGGAAALVAAAVIGPRIGKFAPRTGRARAIPGHSMPLAALGTLLLFFGWFGFNGGSVLALDGPALGHVIVTTAMAGCAGGLAAALFTRARSGKFDVAMTANGILAGLVGITAGADVVSHLMAVVVGLIAGVLVAVAVAFVDGRGIDDPVGASSVHGACGVLGTLWVGFAHVEDGLLYGGGAGLLAAQAIGVVAVVTWVGATVGGLFLLLRSVGFLRVPAHEEIEGLDVHEHGIPGYPELVHASGVSRTGGEYGFAPRPASAPAPDPVED
ncbi:ammonium transporter [Egicoccus sp. AB-alg6-2]|uniref:ammonium transporter n=1 Tax=Egicoccus sp. AB-alg6-2 TaxID=3242692 RepID=UPI00359DFE07